MRHRFLAAAFFLGLLVGCGSGEPSTYRVSGTVSWQGRAVEDGDIIFTPKDGGAAPRAGKIAAGSYELRAASGQHRVEIFATRESGQPDPVMNAKPRDQYIPAQYNSQSTLSAAVQAGDANQIHFDLK
jgi:hypothetical protein